MSLTNSERANRGIRRLSTASDLASIAERHSRDMAAHHRIYHNSNLPNEVHGWRYLGENVGRGSSVRSVHQAFMSSSTHRAHILSTRANQLGVGVVRGSDDYLYITEVFAQRGTTRVSRPARRKTVRRTVHRAHRQARRVRASAAVRPAPVTAPPTLTIRMLMDLLALDAPAPARKYIPSTRAPP